MNRIFQILGCLTLTFCSVSVSATDFDGSKPLVCAIIEVLDCDIYHECARVNANAVNLPDIFRMDIKKKELIGANRTTKITHITHEEGRVILQGSSGNGRGWSVVLTENTGKITGAVAGDDFGFIIFGSCLPD